MYILVHYIDNPLKTKVQSMINHIMSNFDVFDMRGIDPHFTLKYYFENKYLSKVEDICDYISKNVISGFYEVKKLDNFSKDTIFLNVQLDSNSKFLHDILHSKLNEYKIPLNEHEKDGVHLHITLAQKAKKDFPSIVKFLKTHNFNQIQSFSNLTILYFNGSKFKVHKKFKLKNK